MRHLYVLWFSGPHAQSATLGILWSVKHEDQSNWHILGCHFHSHHVCDHSFHRMNIHTLTVSLTMTKLLAFKTAQRVGNVNINFNKLIGTNHDIFWWFRSIESKNKCINLAFDVALLHRYIVAVSNSQHRTNRVRCRDTETAMSPSCSRQRSLSELSLLFTLMSRQFLNLSTRLNWIFSAWRLLLTTKGGMPERGLSGSMLWLSRKTGNVSRSWCWSHPSLWLLLWPRLFELEEECMLIKLIHSHCYIPTTESQQGGQIQQGYAQQLICLWIQRIIAKRPSIIARSPGFTHIESGNSIQRLGNEIPSPATFQRLAKSASWSGVDRP